MSPEGPPANPHLSTLIDAYPCCRFLLWDRPVHLQKQLKTDKNHNAKIIKNEAQSPSQTLQKHRLPKTNIRYQTKREFGAKKKNLLIKKNRGINKN